MKNLRIDRKDAESYIANEFLGCLVSIADGDERTEEAVMTLKKHSMYHLQLAAMTKRIVDGVLQRCSIESRVPLCSLVEGDDK